MPKIREKNGHGHAGTCTRDLSPFASLLLQAQAQYFVPVITSLFLCPYAVRLCPKSVKKTATGTLVHVPATCPHSPLSCFKRRSGTSFSLLPTSSFVLTQSVYAQNL